jgi:hypothetical protein
MRLIPTEGLYAFIQLYKTKSQEIKVTSWDKVGTEEKPHFSFVFYAKPNSKGTKTFS